MSNNKHTISFISTLQAIALNYLLLRKVGIDIDVCHQY